MEEYSFRCKRCASTFDAESVAPTRMMHLIIGVFTLGLWLIAHALFRMFTLYRLSVCPHCNKRSKKLLILFFGMLMGSFEICWVVYYFVNVAPQSIVRDASLTNLPDDINLDDEISSDHYWKVITFISAVALMPTLGLYISGNWPYIFLIWFSIVVIVGYSIPSIYFKKLT